MAKQLEMLTSLDKAKTQGFHFTTIIIAGMGFFTDAYDLICVSTVTKILGRIYYTDVTSKVPGVLPPGLNALVNGIALVGAFVGQLFFGWLGDKLGRKKVYGITAMLMVGSSIASSLSFGSSASAVIGTLCFFRFWLGFGIGGDYPLSATIMSEYANTKTRGAFVGAVFANQGFGILVSAAVATTVASILKAIYPAPPYQANPAASTPPGADYVWRLVLLFGCVPAAMTYYWRAKMPETARFTALVAGDAQKAAGDMERVLGRSFEAGAVTGIPAATGGAHAAKPGSDLEMTGGGGKLQTTASSCEKTGEPGPATGPDPGDHDDDFPLLSRRFLTLHGTHLLATSSTWFLAGLPWYTLNLFEKDVLTAVTWLPAAATMSAIDEVFKIARAQALIALCSIIPGYWVTILLIDRIGRKPIQLQGFFFMAAFLLALGVPYNHWRSSNHIAFVVIYAFTFFFCNFGPNTTTFIVPAEIYPARLRTTCHGISAAVGKLGAILGAFGFQFSAQDPNPSLDDPGYHPGMGVGKTMVMLAGTSALGFLLTFLIPEPKGRSLEDISGDSNIGGDHGQCHPDISDCHHPILIDNNNHSQA